MIIVLQKCERTKASIKKLRTSLGQNIGKN